MQELLFQHRDNDFGKFDERVGNHIETLALVLDVAEFTKFFNKPDVYGFIPRLLNSINQIVTENLNAEEFHGTEPYFYFRGRKPFHVKFLGDGVLVLWRNPDEESELAALLSSLALTREKFEELRINMRPFISDPPPTVRFGVASGFCYPIFQKGHVGDHGISSSEYVGFPLNLASRLQGYCKRLGLLASGRLNISDEKLGALGFVRVVARKLRGMPSDETVIADFEGYRNLPNRERNSLFREVNP